MCASAKRRPASADVEGSLHRPTPCSLRVYLREQSIPEAEPSAFDQILRTLGQRHELEHLASLGDYENLSVVPPDERIEQTAAAIRSRAPVIYQGEFAHQIVIGGIPVTIVGRPDFLILDGDGYVKRSDDSTPEISMSISLSARKTEASTSRC